MRLNKFLAAGTSLSRRSADAAIAAGRVTVNGAAAEQGREVSDTDAVMLDNRAVAPVTARVTIMLNKPRGYVVSRNGQGSETIYDILPVKYQQLNPVGRLDKDSSGLLLLTNDGQLANELTHPSRQKLKVYEVRLSEPLQPLHHQMISDHGIMLDDGLSQLQLEHLRDDDSARWIVRMHEGRNRQIRRTFSALDYTVTDLHRISFGPYTLSGLPAGKVKII